MEKSTQLITKIAPIIILLLLCSTVSGQQKATEAITEEEAKALFENYLKIWNEGNLALIEEVIDPEYVAHHCAFPEDIVGLDGFKNWVTTSRTGFPDHFLTFDEMIVKDDKIVTRWTATGTHTGPLGDLLPPTGKKFRVSGLAITRVANRKVAEEWLDYNVLKLYQQLGFTLKPPQLQEPE